MYQGLGIYKIYRTDTWSYDEYDSAVVIAQNEFEARQTNPDQEVKDILYEQIDVDGESHSFPYSDWTTLENIKAELLGPALEGFEAGTVICASFNAG